MFRALVTRNVVEVVVADATIFGADSVDARRIAHQHASAVLSRQQVVAFKALACLRRHAKSVDAVVVIFESAHRHATRRVLVQLVTFEANALVFHALAPHATSLVAQQQALAVEHLETRIADACSVIATCSIVA